MTKLPFKVVAVDMDGTFMHDDQTFDHKRFDRILTELHKKDSLYRFKWAPLYQITQRFCWLFKPNRHDC